MPREILVRKSQDLALLLGRHLFDRADLDDRAVCVRAEDGRYHEVGDLALAIRNREDLEDLYMERGQTLQGSFSAVSKPNFAGKY